jgi:hypothetical protein
MTKITFCALLTGTVLYACNMPDCKERQLLGEEAKAAIRGYDSTLPYTVVSVPDSLLATGTRDVEPLLDSMVQMRLLTWSLKDSVPRTAADTTSRYRYAIRWTDSLDRYRVTSPVAHSGVYVFMNRNYPEGFHYNARYYLAGNVAILNDDSLYVRRSCVWAQYKCFYKLDSLNALGELTGLQPYGKFARAASFPVQRD